MDDSLSGLGSEGRSVLAVLTLAALWPERFPGGWVSVREFGCYGVYLGNRPCVESLRAAIRRGLRQVRSTAGAKVISRPAAQGTRRRELLRRLASYPPPSLRAWMESEGWQACSSELRDAFREAPTVCPPTRVVVRDDNAALWLRLAGTCLLAAHLASPPAPLRYRSLRRALKRFERRLAGYVSGQ